MTKSAIEQMNQYCEIRPDINTNTSPATRATMLEAFKRISELEKKCSDAWSGGYGDASLEDLATMGKIARHILAKEQEEQAQKPTAPAGLVEELRKVSPLLERDFVIALAIPYMKQAQNGYTAEGAAVAFVDALSRYRPAPRRRIRHDQEREDTAEV